MVVTFIIVVVDFLTIIPSCLLLQKKNNYKIWYFSLLKNVTGSMVWNVKGGGTKGSYSYSKTLIVGS